MTIQYYLIKALTNLHVGSGDANYGVIDNQVQRDVTTGLPTIHSSSLKGALREFCENIEHVSKGSITDIFGGNPKDNNQTNIPGNCKFLSADIISRPVRSDKVPYFNATAPDVLERLNKKCADFGFSPLCQIENAKPTLKKPFVFDETLAGAVAEETDWKSTKDSNTTITDDDKIIGGRPMLMHNQAFKELDLPVIARNHLENGVSKNLWYEEVVPADAYFGFFVIGSEAILMALDGMIDDENVQIGANASIGYGLCKLERIVLTKLEENG